jgi:hypothetical protein
MEREPMNWYSGHIHYADEGMNALVLDAVRPLWERLRPHVDAAFYVRHWRRGPHVRLNVRTDEDTMSAVVRPAVDEIAGGFLAAHPARRSADPEALLPMHRRLAELEYEAGPLMPWRPVNTVWWEPFDSRVRVLGSPEAADLLTDYYTDTTELAFAMTASATSRQRRSAMGYDLMLATAYALSEVELSAAAVSFRSHAEAHLGGRPDGPGSRAGWDAHWERHAGALTGRIGQVIETLDGRRESVPFVREWVAMMRPFQQRARELQAAGRLPMDPGGRPADLGSVSAWHRGLVRSPGWREVESAPWFLRYRLMLNYAYLHLTRLGLAPIDRFLLCHLAALAVQRHSGVSIDDIIPAEVPT